MSDHPPTNSTGAAANRDRHTSPPEPAVAVPDPMPITRVAVFDVPDENVIAPDPPALPALADLTISAPDEVAVPSPEDMNIAPPV